MRTLWVVIPCYNESRTLLACVERAMAAPLPPNWRLRVVLVDDASDAATKRAAQACVERFGGECLRLETHAVNRGKGAALRTGFERVLAESHADDAVLVQDADLEYDPRDWAGLVDALRPGAAVFGNRWADPRSTHGLKRRLHRLVNQVLTMASNLATGYALADMEVCSKLLPVGVLRQALPHLTEDRFGIEPQLTAVLARLGVQIAEVPVRYEARGLAEGKKIRPRDGMRALVVILREWLRGGTGRGVSLVLRTLGAAAGLALVGWCVWIAISRGEWSRLREADPILVLVMLASGVATMFLNGALFWGTVQPLKRLGFWELQSANAMATLINFAPLRAGMLLRIVFHARVDGLPLAAVLAWMAFVAATTLVALGAVVLATMADPGFGWGWALLACALCAAGGWAVRHAGGIAAIARRMHGAERIARRADALAWGIGLRLLDAAAWIVRVGCAASVLGVGLTAPQVALVGVAALAMALNPLGRIGFREAAVAFVSARLIGGGGLDVDTIFIQLAVLESAAEAVVAIPLGALGTAHCVWRWRRRPTTA